MCVGGMLFYVKRSRHYGNLVYFSLKMQIYLYRKLIVLLLIAGKIP